MRKALTIGLVGAMFVVGAAAVATTTATRPQPAATSSVSAHPLVEAARARVAPPTPGRAR
jgi:hypothetical protein